MKREFLKGLAFKVGDQDITLPDEVINNIIAENGKDIEGTKTKLNGQIENLQSQLKTNEGLLNDANAQIEKFNGLDVEGTKKAADEWKTKFEQAELEKQTKEKEYQESIKNQQYDFAVRELTGKHKFTNDFVKNAFVEEFKKQGLKLDESGNFLGADDYIKNFSEKNPGVFVVEAPASNEPQVQFAAATSGNPTPEAKVPLVELMKAKNAGQAIDPNQFNIVKK